MAGFRAIALGAVLGQIAALPTTAQQVDLFGVTSATFEWSPASGPVSGYYVIVARNGGTPSLQGVATQTRATVDSPYGETVSVQVAAFDTTGVAGPLSAPSNTIRFNPPLPSEPAPPPDDPDPQPEPDGDDQGTGSGDPGVPPGEAPVAARFDFDGDGKSDLLLRDPRNGTLALWTMQGVEVAAQTSLAHLPLPWKLEDSGDFDGDGTTDLLWRSTETGQLIVWLVRDGGVATGGGVELGEVTRRWTIAGRGDLDGDGRDDIVLARPRRGTVDILHMDGSRVVSRVAHAAPGSRWRVISTPDADGDGIAELVWENVDNHALALESMATPGAFAPLASQPGSWRVLGAGDLDGDGRDDLLMRDRNTNVVMAWLLDGARVTPASWQAKSAKGWTYRGIGDFNGDRVAEPFWYDSGSMVEIWLSGDEGLEPTFVRKSTSGSRPVGDGGD